MIRPKAIVVGGEAAEAAATGLPAFAEQGHRVASSAPLSWGKESSTPMAMRSPGPSVTKSHVFFEQKHRGRDSTFDPSAANIEQDFPGAGDRAAVPVTASPVLATARFRGAHGYRAVLIDLNHVPSEAAAVDSPPEALSGLGDAFESSDLGTRIRRAGRMERVMLRNRATDVYRQDA